MRPVEAARRPLVTGVSHNAALHRIEIIDRLQKRKVRPARETGRACLLPLSDLLGPENGEEVAMGPGLALGALHEIAPLRLCSPGDSARSVLEKPTAPGPSMEK
jgi:hypothetical protein